MTLSGVLLPADGTYSVIVQASSSQPSSTGSYLVAVYDATVSTYAASFGQQYTGTLESLYDVDNWTFTASANEQIQFLLAAASNPTLEFTLTGPGGYAGFQDLNASSGLITLPASGSYTLSADAIGGQAGSYSFQFNLTSIVSLTLGTPYQGTLVGSGQPQLFQVNVTGAALLVSFNDSSSADDDELYVSSGASPTRAAYQYRSSSATGGAQQILVPSAAAGTYYILLYGAAIPSQSDYSINASVSSLFLTGVTPDYYSNAADATLVLNGAGFDTSTTVDLVGADGTQYPASTIELDSADQISATFDANTAPAGVYSVVVNSANGGSAELASAFTFEAGGEATLSTNLIVPSQIGYHISSTLYVQYSNTGTVAMPAPLLVLTASQDGRDGAIMSLDAANAGEAFATSTMPAGFSNTIEILASGAVPGLLQPGESVQIPVYYGGWVQPWDSPTPPSPSTWRRTRSAIRRPWIGARWRIVSNRLAILRPSGEPYSNVTSRMGSTWGSYAAALDIDASELYHLGEPDNNVQDLWNFEIQQDDDASALSQIATTADISVSTPGLTLEFNRGFATSIVGRYTVGPLGAGWEINGPWQDQLSVQSGGLVSIIQADGSQLLFTPQKGGGYSSPSGDTDTLVALSGGLSPFRARMASRPCFRPAVWSSTSKTPRAIASRPRTRTAS